MALLGSASHIHMGNIHIGHGGHGQIGHGVHGGHSGNTAHQVGQSSSEVTPMSFLKWLPNPRMLFSLTAMFGVSGYIFTKTLHLSPIMAALAAVGPAILFEVLIFAPLWSAMMKLGGPPSTPLINLVEVNGKAVTPFRNGKGIIEVDRDGRAVQFTAYLQEASSDLKIAVNDIVRVVDVDESKERLYVTRL